MLTVFFFQIFIFSFIVGAIVVAAVVTNLDNVMIAQSEEELKENEKQDFISGVFDNEDGSSQTEIKREYSIELDYLTDFSIFATTRHKEGVNTNCVITSFRSVDRCGRLLEFRTI